MKMKKRCVGFGLWEYPRKGWLERLEELAEEDDEELETWEKWFPLGLFVFVILFMIFVRSCYY